MTAVAKADGDMSAEEKSELLRLFSTQFHMEDKEAAGLLVSSSYLLGKGEEVRDNLKSVLAPSLANFTEDQARSARELLECVARVAGPASDLQRRLIDGASRLLMVSSARRDKWA
jgi:uncharacterized tellurite resistance protein B-like protein